MSSEKKRDVAKELVDFLLTENKKDDKGSTLDRKKTEEGRTAVLETTSPYVGVSTKGSVISPIDPTPATPAIDRRADPKPDISSDRGKAIYNEVSKLVGSAEAIHVAQARIRELEKERDELRTEIDNLLVTCESFQRQTGELKAQFESLEKKQKTKLEIVEEEKIVMQSRLQARDLELAELKRMNDDLELRFQNDLQKIRVREKEFENKNMILKAESSAVARAKDEMIMDLKRKIDQYQFEIDNFKSKFSQSESVMNEMRERQIRSIKALRLALSILENDEYEENTQVNENLKVEMAKAALKKASGDE